MSGWLTQGPRVAEFEKAFADRHSVKHALATTSCTTGLHLILAAMEIGEGDEVIVPAFTWVATANVVLYCGATPVFVDVDRKTNNIDPAELERKLSPRTRAVIVVHLFGLCADMDAIRAVIPNDIRIIEDAACAAGASYKGTSAGALGDRPMFPLRSALALRRRFRLEVCGASERHWRCAGRRRGFPSTGYDAFRVYPALY